ncbi:sensory neuron membrane protein 1-like [Macrosteles quadrilineatus]|uniref:sensory neuron membrane protein 1-like n=1 Tax=Macrosteles quadrilineatus TaxID=74068 RepID=UPI0023E1E60C|nr:sensory neuron membrane protein 1-like [Macrosteles quadrilineatus]
MISEEAMQRMKTKVQQRVGRTPPATWAKVGVGVLVGGVAIGWIAFPYVLDKVVASQINLAQGKDSRRLWVQLPTLDCMIYVFNVTNPAEVMRGAKPIVQEIGPYCYKEIKDKTDFVEDPAADTISYSARSTWYADQKSPGCPTPQLTGDEVITVPNVPILSILLIAEKDFPAPFLTLVSQALPAIFGRVSDMFMRVTVKSLLFDGILINCTATALYPRAVCIALKQNSRALKKISENVYSFSFFGAKNNTPEEFRYTVKRGTVDGQDIGKMVAIDGKPELPFWRGDCNKIQGTDASVFPPFRKMENGSLMAYSSEICRSIFGIFEGEADYKGVNGYVYAAYPFGDVETNPGDRCFCSADDRCRKKGVLDALKCQGAPIVVSHPHFYEASQQYLDGVVGLKPDKEKHGIKIILEPISGSPLVARKRIQFNIELKPIRFVPVTQRLRRSLVPLFWAEELLDLDGNLMGMLEASLFRPIRAVDVIKWLCVVGGVGLGILGIVLKIRKTRRDKVHEISGGNETEFDYKSKPKSAVKPDKVDSETEVLDPFYVRTQDNYGNKDKIKNGLQAVISTKSAPTMTNSRPTSFAKLDVQQLLNQGNKGVVSKFISGQEESNDAPLSVNDDKRSNTEESPQSSIANSGDTANINTLTQYTGVALQTPSSSALLQSPKTIASLEHQMSFQSADASNILSSPGNPTHELPIAAEAENNRESEVTFEKVPQLIVNNNIDTSTIGISEQNENPQIDVESQFMQMKNAVEKSFPDENDLQIIDSTDINGNENTLNVHIMDDKTYDNKENDPPGSESANNATEEEIKAVEDDINRLVAEMAELLPRNNSFGARDQ